MIFFRFNTFHPLDASGLITWQETRSAIFVSGVGTVLVQCWVNTAHLGPAVTQHWASKMFSLQSNGIRLRHRMEFEHEHVNLASVSDAKRCAMCAAAEVNGYLSVREAATFNWAPSTEPITGGDYRRSIIETRPRGIPWRRMWKSACHLPANVTVVNRLDPYSRTIYDIA